MLIKLIGKGVNHVVGTGRKACLRYVPSELRLLPSSDKPNTPLLPTVTTHEFATVPVQSTVTALVACIDSKVSARNPPSEMFFMSKGGLAPRD